MKGEEDDQIIQQIRDKKTELPEQDRADIAASFQFTALSHILQRTKRAIFYCKENLPQVNTLVVGGGVACNQELRLQLSNLAKEFNFSLIFPPPQLCTDNGVMIGMLFLLFFSLFS